MEKINQLEFLMDQGVFFQYKDIVKNLDLFSLQEHAMIVLTGRRSQIDITMELE